MNPYLLIILVILIGHCCLNAVVDLLNVRSAASRLPEEFAGFYDPDKYRQSQEYLKDNTVWSIGRDITVTLVTIVFMLGGGFNAVDIWARQFGWGPVATGLVFSGVLLLGMQVVTLPFEIYHTFVIEQKFGFNKTTPALFAVDKIKGLLLGAVIGGAVLALILVIFEHWGKGAWLAGWVAITLVQIFLIFIAPVTIMPLFNKFIPLEDGELKAAIEAYAAAQRFQLQGIFKMDGSRRSTKANAYFTGFGQYKRIALFDTLIAQHSVDELVAVLAHEVGHFKRKHIQTMLLVSVAQTGVMLGALGWFINNPHLFAAFRMEHVSVYASIVFFAFLFTPISLIFGVCANVLSRRHEFEADRFAVTTYGHADALVAALKKLSVSNLSNLTPHPWKVFFDYSHPPILQRLDAIRKAGRV